MLYNGSELLFTVSLLKSIKVHLSIIKVLLRLRGVNKGLLK